MAIYCLQGCGGKEVLIKSISIFVQCIALLSIHLKFSRMWTCFYFHIPWCISFPPSGWHLIRGLDSQSSASISLSKRLQPLVSPTDSPSCLDLINLWPSTSNLSVRPAVRLFSLPHLETPKSPSALNCRTGSAPLAPSWSYLSWLLANTSAFPSLLLLTFTMPMEVLNILLILKKKQQQYLVWLQHL